MSPSSRDRPLGIEFELFVFYTSVLFAGPIGPDELYGLVSYALHLALALL